MADGPKAERRGGSRTRDRILDAALELFGSKGFAGTRTRDIAKRAGVNEVTLFRTFGSKQGVYTAMLAERSLLPAVMSAVEFDLESPVDEMMARNMEGVLRTLKDNRHMFVVILSDAWRHQRTRRMIGDVPMQKAVESLSSSLKAQMDRGRLRRMDPDIAARALMGMVQGYFLTTYLLQGSGDDPARDRRFVKGFVSVCLDGLRPEEAVA